MSIDIRSLAVSVGASNAYAGTCYAVHDGDTIHVSVLDPLLSVPVILAVRIAGINAPELSEPGGIEVRDALRNLLTLGTVVTLTGVHADKYAGRVDARVVTAAGLDVAGWLLERGYAIAWNGVGTKPLVPWPPPEVQTT
jgi:endonuclease YncB( thermonuclease family)